MNLSKRPKGNEIEDYVSGSVGEAKAYHKNWESSEHPELVSLIKGLRRDVTLLMAHLKLEFRDVPGTPAKRIVGKATKKTKKEKAWASHYRIIVDPSGGWHQEG